MKASATLPSKGVVGQSIVSGKLSHPLIVSLSADVRGSSSAAFNDPSSIAPQVQKSVNRMGAAPRKMGASTPSSGPSTNPKDLTGPTDIMQSGIHVYLGVQGITRQTSQVLGSFNLDTRDFSPDMAGFGDAHDPIINLLSPIGAAAIAAKPGANTEVLLSAAIILGSANSTYDFTNQTFVQDGNDLLQDSSEYAIPNGSSAMCLALITASDRGPTMNSVWWLIAFGWRMSKDGTQSAQVGQAAILASGKDSAPSVQVAAPTLQPTLNGYSWALPGNGSAPLYYTIMTRTAYQTSA
jgi:hypothetical protein